MNGQITSSRFSSMAEEIKPSMAATALTDFTGPESRVPSPRSLLLQWHITERCDHACSHCYQAEREVDLPFDSLLEILDQFSSFVKSVRLQNPLTRIPAHINVTGGEPFLRSDFFDLLEKFHLMRERFSFAILTSGSLIDDKVARRLAALKPGFVQVSLEGTQQTHDSIRGSGDYERVLAAIGWLINAGIDVMMSFTAHRNNFREFPHVASIGRKLGVKRVWADRFVPVGGAEQQRDLVLTAEETDELLSIMVKSRKQRSLLTCRTEIAMHRALQFRVGDGRPYRCQAGRELITVMADGTLVPCRRMPLPVGNLLQEPLEKLYLDSSLFRGLREDAVPAGCINCFYSQACRGGLRCLALAAGGSYHLADPGCSLADNRFQI
jgi:radical SAM protein with 4Fe4S-binding SPASM domain